MRQCEIVDNPTYLVRSEAFIFDMRISRLFVFSYP